jgi:hypothetical protein
MRKINPIVYNVVVSQEKVRSTRDTPCTAINISNVSHREAVNTTGAALQILGWLAPWLNTKTFWTPNGMIRPNARMIP